MFSAGAEKEHLPKMDSIESLQKPKMPPEVFYKKTVLKI